MSEKKWFRVTFTALLEADDIDDARAVGVENAEAIDEHIGSHAQGDPFIYRVELASVEPFEGKLPWDAEEEAEEARRAEALERERLFRAGQLRSASNPLCPHGSLSLYCSKCEADLEQTRIAARAFLQGLTRGTRGAR